MPKNNHRKPVSPVTGHASGLNLTVIPGALHCDPHSIRARFLLHGDLGVTQFLIQFLTKPYGEPLLDSTPAEGWDLGFHSREPIDYATEMEECDVVPEGRCWYDGSGLQAKELARLFFERGEPVVWEWLEDRYRHWLSGTGADRG